MLESSPLLHREADRNRIEAGGLVAIDDVTEGRGKERRIKPEEGREIRKKADS